MKKMKQEKNKVEKNSNKGTRSKNKVIASNQNIGTRLKGTFARIMIYFLIIDVVSIVSINVVANNLKRFYNKPYVVVTQTWNIKSELESKQKILFQSINIPDVKLKVENLKDLDRNDQSIKDSMDKMKKLFAGKQELYKEFEDSYNKINDVENKIRELISKNQGYKAIDMIELEFNPAINEAINVIEKISEYADSEANSFVKSGQLTGIIVALSLIGLSIILFFVIISLSKKIIDSIIKPIYEVEQAAKELARGNLDAKVDYEGKDEIGLLANSLRETIKSLQGYIGNISYTLGEMASNNLDIVVDIEYTGDFQPIKTSMLTIADSLSKTLSQIDNTASLVSASANQVQDASHAIAEGSSNQSSSVEELFATVNVVSDQVNTNAEHAKEVKIITEQFTKEIDDSNEYMNKLLDAMLDIEGQAREISQIIGVIDSIAEETNLLSLNASIEAARAGEHGRGFAVVASEIGKLANDCRKAAKDTNELISKTLGVVKLGSSIADETSLVLKEIVKSSDKTNSLVGEISKASGEQAFALEEVLLGIGEIARVTEDNSAVAEEANATSVELVAQAEKVKELFEQFTLKQ